MKRIALCTFAVLLLCAPATAQTTAERKTNLKAFIDAANDTKIVQIEDALTPLGYQKLSVTPAPPAPQPVAGFGPRKPVGVKSNIVLPTNSVRITVGTSWQSKIDANPTGTVFVIASGVHSKQSIRPRDNQEFIGEAGAIADGEGVASQFVRSGGSKNNLFKNLLIRNYANPLQDGCIGNMPASRVEDCEITGCNGYAIRVGGWIKGSYVHHNHQGGLTSYKTTGALIEDCEFSFDNWQNKVSSSSTAKMWYCDAAIIRYCHFHDNQHGLWFDSNNRNCEVHNCLIENNQRNGIYYEISYGAKIHDNLIRFANKINDDYAGVRLQNSRGCEIWNNTISDCYSGVQYASSERSNPTEQLYGDWITRDNYAHDNTISRCTKLSQNINWGDDHNPLATTANNRFDKNKYKTGQFYWGANKTWTQWQSLPQDANGTYQP